MKIIIGLVMIPLVWSLVMSVVFFDLTMLLVSALALFYNIVLLYLLNEKEKLEQSVRRVKSEFHSFRDRMKR